MLFSSEEKLSMAFFNSHIPLQGEAELCFNLYGRLLQIYDNPNFIDSFCVFYEIIYLFVLSSFPIFNQAV